MNKSFFRDLELIFKDEKQKEAFSSIDNTVVVAGPGSGKTRILSLKAVSLSRDTIHKPSGLAVISFSRESVRELKKRLALYGFLPNRNDFIGTVHSFSLLHVIEPFGHLYPQYNISYPIKILPDEISNVMYSEVLEELGVDSRALTLSDLNKTRTLTLVGRSTIEIPSSNLIINGAKIYESKIRKSEFIDFTDIINIAAIIISEQEYVRSSLKSKFPWLLVDEYQDLGKALHEMVLELVFNAGIKLYAVGDMNQSIYGFNGGYPEFLKELSDYDDINTIHLTSNYRSSKHIIEASKEALQPTLPFPKYLAKKEMNAEADFTFITCSHGMDEQYDIVAKKVIPKLIAKDIPLNEIGILTGNNNQTHQLANHLLRQKIPYYIAKWSFENSAVIVWLQDCAKWSNKKTDQSFDELFRFWKTLLQNHDETRKNLDDIELKTKLFKVINLNRNTEDLLKWLNNIIKELNLEILLENSEIYPNEVKNINNLLDEAKLKNLKNSTLERFASLGYPHNEVTITTRHSSKGLEFETVILLGMEMDNFPIFFHRNNPLALAEDQRLCYVCISRARKSCILIRSEEFTINGKYGPFTKKFQPSPYWNSLHEKFGDDSNTFSSEEY
jgi:DNA helicase II / ATP-dependent DNA helicase PcrA